MSSMHESLDEGLKYRGIDDPYYWKEELEDVKTGDVRSVLLPATRYQLRVVLLVTLNGGNPLH